MKPSAKFKRAMEHGRAAMEPYLDQMESESGMLAMLMVQFAALGKESPAELAHTIEQASILSGIPEDALKAHAHFTTAMLEGYEADQQKNAK